MKSISVRFLDLIDNAQGREVLCVNIDSYFIQANTKQKIFIRFGYEFGDRAGCIALIS